MTEEQKADPFAGILAGVRQVPGVSRPGQVARDKQRAEMSALEEECRLEECPVVDGELCEGESEPMPAADLADVLADLKRLAQGQPKRRFGVFGTPGLFTAEELLARGINPADCPPVEAFFQQEGEG